MSTIAAISTPNAAGGIGIVRLSGEEAIAIAARCFHPFSGKAVADMKGYTAAYGEVFDADGPEIIFIDGENELLEFSCGFRKRGIDFFCEKPFSTSVYVVPRFDALAYAGFIRKACSATVDDGFDFRQYFFQPSHI